MAINASTAPKTGGVKQEILPIGSHMARLVQVVDLGVHRNHFDPSKAPKRRISLTYELCNKFVKDAEGNEDKEKPRWISHEFDLNHLTSDLATSTKVARALDPANTHRGDFIAMLGSPCMITIVHNQKKTGEVYAKIGVVSSAIDGIPYPALRNEPTALDLEEPNMEVFMKLPEWVKEKIQESLDFNGSPLHSLLKELDDAATAAGGGGAFPSEAGGMDDVPFN